MRPSLETLKGKKNLVGCEIGVNSGANAQDIFINLDIKKLYLVDCWAGGRKPDYAKKLLAKLEDRIMWLEKRSEDVTDEEIPRNSLDFVYIDGNHTYEAVKKDLKNYWPRVKGGGLVAGHDYGNENGVKDAVDEFLGGSKFFYDSGEHDWWVYR